MSTIPTVEQFLAEQSSELDVEAEHVDPLESIAESLRLMSIAVAGMVTDGEPLTAELVTGADEEAEEMLPKYIYDDLVEKYDVVLNLIRDVEAALGKSTAKPSLAAKAVIDAWKNPQSPAVDADHITKAEREQMMADEQGQDVVYVCPHCKTGWGEIVNLCTECGRMASGERVIHPAAPAHDADVTAWREFAGRMGVEGAQAMNRSQIRTALGIDQLAGA
jgi:hypothetical protein